MKNNEMTHTKKLSPLVGESVSGADERGKREKIRKNRKISVSQTEKCRNDSHEKAVPVCREASEPLFEERSDAVKVCVTPYPTQRER